jgi:dTDP-glucose pyrophosphorylase
VLIRTFEDKMNLVITMGGLGSRFGNRILKPFIKINGKPMFLWAELSALNFCKNEFPNENYQIYGCIKTDFIQVLNSWISISDSTMFPLVLPHQTKGPAESVYLCDLNLDEELIVHDCDLIAKLKVDKSAKMNLESDLMIYYTRSVNPQHSFIEIESGHVLKIAEKSRISENGVVGIYVFRSKRLFNHLYENTLFQKESYISEVVKTALRLDYRVAAKMVSSCLSFGTPEELSENIELIDEEFFKEFK